MTPAEVADWTAASRQAQQLPERIEDMVVLARVATLAFAGDQKGGAVIGVGRPAAMKPGAHPQRQTPGRTPP
jgi:hypothetical protein